MRAAQLMMGVAVAALAAGQAQADLVISNKATSNVNCVSGVCTATAAKAVLNAGDLTNMLAAGDVAVKTGGGATNIVVKAPLSWTSVSRLTLDAKQSVEIDRPMSVTGTGAMTVTTNHGGSGGDLMFDGRGNMTFWDTSSSLVINGNHYKLVKDITTLASDIANNASGFYALANDYNAAQDGTYTSAPITTTFQGTFEGLGHDIDGLTINASSDSIGLFRQAGGPSGTLRDIDLTNAAVTGTTIDFGGTLLGMSNGTNIIGCHATGSVVLSSARFAGGLVGNSNVTPDRSLVRSRAAVSVKAVNALAVGGLVGQSGFAISLSRATGSVVGGDGADAGGLVGLDAAPGSIRESYASGDVSAGENANVGGLVGRATGTIENAYATGAVDGATGSSIGGFVGTVSGNEFSSYSTGLVHGKTAGGFLGSGIGGSASADYWDVDTSGKGKHHGCGGRRCSVAIRGLTTAQFQSALPEGFDPSIWAEKSGINGGYPYLIANPSK